MDKAESLREALLDDMTHGNRGVKGHPDYLRPRIDAIIAAARADADALRAAWESITTRRGDLVEHRLMEWETGGPHRTVHYAEHPCVMCAALAPSPAAQKGE